MKKRILQMVACMLGTLLLWMLAIRVPGQYQDNIFTMTREENHLTITDSIRIAWENLKKEMWVCQIEGFPKYGTEEEMRDYFLERHPSADCYEVYAPRESAEDNFLPIVATENFYLVEGKERVYGYFRRGENTYIVSSKDEVLNYVEKVSGTLWECHTPIAEWRQSEDSVTWNNYNEWIAEAVLYAEDGESLLVKSAPVASVNEENVRGKILEVEVYKAGEEAPFQVFETEDTSFYRSHGICFDDFNADGCIDIHFMLNFTPQHGGDWYYIWSSLQDEFVRCPEELENWYMAFPPMRRIATYQNVSGNAQEIRYYQWENEVDYRLLMWYRYEYMYDDKTITYMVKYYDEDGKETLLLDCAVEMNSKEDYWIDSLLDIHMNIVDQKVLQEEQNGEVYYVYLSRGIPLLEEEEKDYIYVINEDMYPINMLVVESGSAIGDFGVEELLGQDKN